MGKLKDGREVSDLEMMKDPDLWPRLTLPLKRPPWGIAMLATSNGEMFYLFENKSMFERLEVDDTTIGPLTKEELQTVLDRGWVVD